MHGCGAPAGIATTPAAAAATHLSITRPSCAYSLQSNLFCSSSVCRQTEPRQNGKAGVQGGGSHSAAGLGKHSRSTGNGAAAVQPQQAVAHHPPPTCRRVKEAPMRRSISCGYRRCRAWE